MKLWCCYVPNLGSYSYVKLGDISEVITKGTTAKKFLNDGVAFIKIESINSRTTLGNKLSYISEEEHKTYLKRSILKEGDILFSIAGALGIVHIVQKEELPANTNQALSIIRLKQKEKIEYVSWFLETPSIKKMILELKSIGAQPNLSLEQISNIKIPMLSSNKLEHIVVELLNTIEKRIETQNKIIEKYESLIKQLNDDIFSRGDNSKISDFIQELSKRNKEGAVTNVLSVSNKNGFVKQSEQFEDKELASEDKTNYKIVQKGDFAFNPARINVGSIALLKNQEIGIVSPMYICFKAKNIPSEILESYFSSSSFKKEMNKRLEGSVRMCLTIDGMKNIRFHNPSKKEIDILSRLTKLKELVVISKRILDLYNSQKSYLLSNLFI